MAFTFVPTKSGKLLSALTEAWYHQGFLAFSFVQGFRSSDGCRPRLCDAGSLQLLLYSNG